MTEAVCWHCGVVLACSPKLRCEDCPDECDTEDCKEFGCNGETQLIDEVQRRMDQIVEAAVEWHQAGREGGEWLDKAEALAAAIESLLELRSKPETATPPQ